MPLRIVHRSLCPITPCAVSNIRLTLCRVQQDRREQARQDLKGLEETVVSYWHVHLNL